MNEDIETVEGLADQAAGYLAGLMSDGALLNLGDDALLVLAGSMERLGRLVDTGRAVLATETVSRSECEARQNRLSSKKGCRNGIELLARVTRQSESTLHRRARLGSRILPSYSLIGVAFPAPFPAVASAMQAGALGADSATIIMNALTRLCAPEELLRGAEDELVAAACGLPLDGHPAEVPHTAEQTRIEANTWRARLDPDGVLTSEEHAMRSRGVSKGHLNEGVVNYRLALMPETSAIFESIFASLLAPTTGTVFLTDEERAEAEASKDPRSWTQQRHDILASLLDTASRDKDLPQIGGTPPAIIVTVREQDLAAGTGAAYIDGLDTAISVHAAAQRACTAGIQKVVINANGEIIQLGAPDRVFTPQQRKAIAARDGGCVIPGCTVPMMWVEIHHVHEYQDGGPTHTSNGVALCWFHHRTIHTSGWQIQMRNGAPWVKMPKWLTGYNTPNPWKPTTKSPTRLLNNTDTG